MSDMPSYLQGLLLAFGILFILGAVFFSIGMFLKQRTRDWDVTQGIIIKRGTLFPGLPDKHPTFEYVVDGQTYRKTSAISQTPGFTPGSRVTVKYDPYRPERAAIDSVAQGGLIFLILGSVFLAVSVGLLFVLLFLRNSLT
ncbi:DUF3592 domain-containing protein [Paenibacillus daejeonensis]|uniref:DUF3592 domain-containing protein n=1 Tax=Paenibacillus daejeonensis TaxID=135193 RepID=UPI000364BBCE|nr:DUF3592 domain-containing protein [Paenibacillus daejeonensis]